ncbi:MAG: ABC transporter substrate-binding protein, partial [Desulfocucumaceae bacterium]
MKRKIIPIMLAVTLLMLLVAGCGGGGQPASKEPIKLGVMVPLSGPSAATGQEMRNAYMMAAEELNAQGLLGRKVELVIEDSKDPTAAVAALEKLMNRDKVSILMGEVSSTVGYALAE